MDNLVKQHSNVGSQKAERGQICPEQKVAGQSEGVIFT